MDGVFTRRGGSKLSFIMTVIGTLVTGTINSVIMKEQDLRKNSSGLSFFHPVMQTLMMFIGELLTLITYCVMMAFSADFKNEYVFKRELARKQGISIKINPFIPFLAALVDLVGSTLQFIAIYFMNPSVYVMLRGGVPVTTVFLSIVFLKTKVYGHHIFGLLLVLLGVASTGFVECYQEGKDSFDAIFGLVLILISLITTGIQYVIEEKIMAKYYFHPLSLVGYEGLWGVLLTPLAIFAMNFIPCSLDDPYCHTGHLENISDTLNVIINDITLLVLIVVAIINSVFFNYLGVTVTNIAPLPRVLISIAVTGLVWGFSVAFLSHGFYIFQLVGFVLLGLGNLIYQEVVEIPGLNQNTRKNLEKRALFNESLAVEDSDEEEN